MKLKNIMVLAKEELAKVSTTWHLENWLKQYRPYFEKEDYIKSMEKELMVAKQIEEISNHKLKCKFSGLGAGKALEVEDWIYDPNRPLDITVYYNEEEKPRCRIEVQTTYKYTFERSKFLPVQEHKTKQALQSGLKHYFVYIHDYAEEIELHWSTTEEIIKYPAINMRTKLKRKIVYQTQHPTDTSIWKEGLTDLIKIILGNSKDSKPQKWQ